MSETKTAQDTSHDQEAMVVRLSRLDQMLQLAGEVIIVSSNINALSHQFHEGVNVSRQLNQDIKDLAITSSRISSDLHNLVTDVRTVDMQDLFARFRRLARDTSRRLGKAIRFNVEGESVCIDKKISEKIYDPIAHQIRNAIAHGIEDQQTRVKQGKDPLGNVTLRVQHQDNVTRIDIVDDGAGINYDRVRGKVVALGLADAATAGAMSDAELQEYLFHSGFSTAQETSSSAGRGVGMDVIKTVMDEINGEMQIESQAGVGTTFSMLIPRVTAVNISDALLVKSQKTYFAFPITSVVATRSVERAKINTTTGQGKSILYLGHVLPLFDLMEVLGEAPLELDDQVHVIIVEHKKRRAGFVVSDFLNPQKIVISEFEKNIQVRGLTGTAILSGRQMGMVIDLPALFELTFGSDSSDSRGARATAGGTGAVATDANGAEAVSGASLPVEGGSSDNAGGQAEAANTTAARPVTSGSAEDGDSDDGGGGEALTHASNEFLYEVESMLGKLNRELLSLEETKEDETANSVFRLMHSIKGNLTMYGAEKPAAVTHKIETVLESVREDMENAADGVFDIFFDGASYLEEVVRACLNQQAPPEPLDEFMGNLQDYLDSHQQVPTAQATVTDTSHIPLDATGQFYLSSRRCEGVPLFQCKMEFEASDQPDFLLAYLILRRIQSVADVLGSAPTMTELEQGICGNQLNVLLSPRDSREGLMALLGENLQRYYHVTAFEAMSYS